MKNHTCVSKTKEMNKIFLPFNFPAADKNEINRINKSLDFTKATGGDKIPLKLVKVATKVIGSYICNMLNHNTSVQSFQKKAKFATLRKKCPYLELFWFVFSRIRTEYRKIQSISSYSVRIWENTD